MTKEPAASAFNSGRLKYADPKDLPSFPSSGLSSDGAAASAAASLGWANHKSPEPWRPDKSSASAAAASLAKDYKASPLWEPSQSSGANKAALLAVGSAGAAIKQQRQQHPPASGDKKVSQETWGNSAANQAFHASRASVTEKQDLASGGSAATQAFNKSPARKPEPTAVSSPSAGDRSLAAAKGAMSSSKHTSSPDTAAAAMEARRLENSAAASALNGATLAHRNSLIVKAPIGDAGAVPVTTMTRNMFTSHPPVKPEVDEKANNERLHQTAVEMAKKMYLQQQKILDQTKDAHEEESDTPYAGTYLNLQDAAHKQAQERLAKLHDEHQQNRDYQEYYGNSTTTPKRTFSLANKLRRRSSSDGGGGSSRAGRAGRGNGEDDRERSQRIREQMSMFSTKLSQVDKEKRSKDREALLAAAQRNVKARLQGMDEKVYKDTGKRNSSMLSEFELKAQQAAQSRSDTRNENKGKIDIGGGKFMTQEEINAIAAKRMQPVLDDINEKAETERERILTLKLEEEARREEAEKQKTRDREARDISKRLKDEEKQEEKAKKAKAKEEAKALKEQEKAKKLEQKQEEKAKRDELKQEEKAKKDAEKAAKAEELRLAKEEKRKSKVESAEAKKDSSELAPALATTAPEVDAEEDNAEDDAESKVESRVESRVEDDAEEQTEEPIEKKHEDKATKEALTGETSDQRGDDSDSDASALASTIDEDETREVASPVVAGSHTEQTESIKRSSIASSSSPKKGKVRGWLKNRLSRGKSLADKDNSGEKTEKADKRRSIFGGLSKKERAANDSAASIENRSSSIRDVALAGKGEEKEAEYAAAKETEDPERPDSRGVSPVSTPGGDNFEDARQSRSLEVPKTVEEEAGRLSSSPAPGSRFKEEIQ